MKLSKIIASSTLIALLFSCISSPHGKTISWDNDSKNIKKEKPIPLDSNELLGMKLMQDSLLVGEITFQDLKEDPFLEWFDKEYNAYNPDTKTLDDFGNNPEKLEALSVKIYIGTWCEDSRREVPRFYKIMQFLNKENCELIALDKNKKTKNGLEVGMNIHHVPTFILYQNGEEINRIIEYPIETLEKDIISIIQKGEYVPRYEEK